jgi:hypothetical protein
LNSNLVDDTPVDVNALKAYSMAVAKAAESGEPTDPVVYSQPKP